MYIQYIIIPKTSRKMYVYLFCVFFLFLSLDFFLLFFFWKFMNKRTSRPPQIYIKYIQHIHTHTLTNKPSLLLSYTQTQSDVRTVHTRWYRLARAKGIYQQYKQQQKWVKVPRQLCVCCCTFYFIFLFLVLLGRTRRTQTHTIRHSMDGKFHETRNNL